MKKFKAKFLRIFEVEVEADDASDARTIGADIVGQFPQGTCKLLSVIEEGHEDATCAACADAEKNGTGPHTPKGGPPTLGGSPATPVVKLPKLADQVAEAA
jgi:hypothetical protein